MAAAVVVVCCCIVESLPSGAICTAGLVVDERGGREDLGISRRRLVVDRCCLRTACRCGRCCRIRERLCDVAATVGRLAMATEQRTAVWKTGSSIFLPATGCQLRVPAGTWSANLGGNGRDAILTKPTTVRLRAPKIHYQGCTLCIRYCCTLYSVASRGSCQLRTERTAKLRPRGYKFLGIKKVRPDTISLGAELSHPGQT